MLVLSNVTIKPSNVRKKIREPLNVIKVRSHEIMVLPNLTMELSSVRKMKKTKKEPSNVTKEQLRVMLKLHNMRMKPINVKKNKENH